MTDEANDVTDEASDDTRPEPLLSAVEARVLGCLTEKKYTTPNTYPLTLNALVQACNQKTGRHPGKKGVRSNIEAFVQKAGV